MKSNSERNHIQAKQKRKKEKYVPAESINNMLHFNRIWFPIMCGIKVIVLLAISSGTIRQINGKRIWQVINLHFCKSVGTKSVLGTSPIPWPVLPHTQYHFSIRLFAFFWIGLWAAWPYYLCGMWIVLGKLQRMIVLFAFQPFNFIFLFFF